jgi:hypothetical protein
VEYRPGCLNVVADALSWREDLDARSCPSFQLYDDLRREFDEDAALSAFRDSVVQDRGDPWRVVEGLVLRGNRVYIPPKSAFLPDVLQIAHSVGHEGI